MTAGLTGIYDVIVLDVMMPKLSGFEVANQLRRGGVKTPILMLTAKSDVDDKVTGLDSGADDYLTKPFHTKELLARIRALCRRVVDSDDNSLHFGDIALDLGTAMLSCITSGQSVRLGYKEFRIMEYMLKNHKQILTREQLALKIWGYDNEVEYNNVEVLPFESVAFEQGRTIESDITDGIFVSGNPSQLSQVVSILLDNAIRHSRGGNTVAVSLHTGHKQAVLTVTNFSEPIPAEKLERLFERSDRVGKYSWF